ncbi:hypothetical protein E4T47_00577 [Aureobasidium subglaciale]|nr:hypothetical protein E4T47_00577 [Aureobasidium subglaciale]
MADDTVSHEQRHILLSIIERYEEINDTAAQAEQTLNYILQKIVSNESDQDTNSDGEIEVCKWPGCQEISSTPIELWEKHPSLAPAQKTEAEVSDEDGEEVEDQAADKIKGAVKEKD